MVKHYAQLSFEPFAELDKIEVTAPFDQSIIATADVADEKSVNSALHIAYQQFIDRPNWLSKKERLAILNKAAQLMETQIDTLAIEAAREGGKPLIDSRVEVIRAIESIRLCADTLRNSAGQEIPMGINPSSEKHLAFTSHEPIGVVVAVSAFNHPLNLIAHQVGPAIAAGCPVIVKPAQDTPLSCLRLVNILYDAGLPKEWCQALLITDRELATALVTDERVAFFSFIGSAQVGWMLRSKLAPGTRCALEHGGVAPVIIAADADLEKAVTAVAKGGFYHAGQVCVSVQRIFCHRQIADEFTARLAQIADKLIVGDPTLEETEVGPLIRPKELERIDQWVKEAVSEGATLITGGKKLSASCYAPTILLNPAKSSKISQQEVFGPVVVVYFYEDIDDAIHNANALPFAFQAAIFTNSLDLSLKAYKQLAASAVMVNDHTAFRVDWMPFAGLKHSGLGVGGIPHTFQDMQIEKMLVIKSTEL